MFRRGRLFVKVSPLNHVVKQGLLPPALLLIRGVGSPLALISLQAKGPVGSQHKTQGPQKLKRKARECATRTPRLLCAFRKVARQQCPLPREIREAPRPLVEARHVCRALLNPEIRLVESC